jgi:hypothetical protein
MQTFDSHRHFWLGENHQHFPGQEVIFKLSFPRVFIRYEVDRAIFADFDEFFASIAEVQWIDGERPDDATQLQILADAWNFLCIEEQILERDMRENEEDLDF